MIWTLKKFWKTFKPLFSEKEVPGFDKLILVENETIISNNKDIAECMNSYFSHITDTLDIKKWPMPNDINPTDDNVTIAIKKYESHPSIKMIKRTIGNDKKFEFTHIYPNDICSHIKRLNTSKSVSGQIPISIWKSAIDICGNKLTDCANASLYDCKFPSTLKLADVTPTFKNDDKI